MNNETQPTPEQLAKWREAGNMAWRNHHNPAFSNTPQTTYVQGYLRRCQENEQSLKDARKQTLEEAIAEVHVFESGGSNVAAFAKSIGLKLKELLNDK